MAGAKAKLSSESAIPFKSKNKQKRQAFQLKQKKAKESLKRDEKFRRKREEDKNPELREKRHALKIPATLDRKRVWDEIDNEEGTGLGLSVDISEFHKRRKQEAEDGDHSAANEGLTESKLKRLETGIVVDESADDAENEENQPSEQESEEDEDLASILDEESEEDDHGDEDPAASDPDKKTKSARNSSPGASVASTNISLIPEALAAKFSSLFKPIEMPKTLITTQINGTVHEEASVLTQFLPNSHYVPRTKHRFNAHHYSLREIVRFATNREYTALVVMCEDQKRPSGLTVIHLPEGPTFHFSISNWVEGKKLPGHGNPTNHYPELILHNFCTPLGLLTAHLFRTMFPSQPEIEGRQVVTLHNQRDYIFVRRHRYIFRDKRTTEKSVTGTDGKAVKGVEDIRAGLQELGPRFTLKLRRVDRGVQRASGQEWEWKPRMEKQRTKFQL